jgi:hypothetical protein
MQIVMPNLTTPSNCSIEGIQIRKELMMPNVVNSYLSVSLKPEPQSRPRFEGSSYETRTTSPSELRIDFGELQAMVEALTRELDVCYHILAKKGLLHDMATIVDEINIDRAKRKIGPIG